MDSPNAFEISRSLAETSSGHRAAVLINDVQVGAVIGVVCALLCLTGCGGSSGGGIPPSVVSHILSNPALMAISSKPPLPRTRSRRECPRVFRAFWLVSIPRRGPNSGLF
jgi:hypothetical protein